MTVTKGHLAEMLYEELGLNKREAKELVAALFEEMRASLESGESVRLSGFGNFELRDKRERPGRNPKTGEMIPTVPGFSPTNDTPHTTRPVVGDTRLRRDCRCVSPP